MDRISIRLAAVTDSIVSGTHILLLWNEVGHHGGNVDSIVSLMGNVKLQTASDVSFL